MEDMDDLASPALLATPALIGTWGGLFVANVVIALLGPPLPVQGPRCASRHYASSEQIAGRHHCLDQNDKLDKAMLDRLEREDKAVLAERKARAAKQGPIITYIRGDQ